MCVGRRVKGFYALKVIAVYWTNSGVRIAVLFRKTLFARRVAASRHSVLEGNSLRRNPTSSVISRPWA